MNEQGGTEGSTSQSVFNGMLSICSDPRHGAQHDDLMLVVLLLTVALNVLLIVRIPRFFRSRTPVQSWAECRGAGRIILGRTIRSNSWEVIKADPAAPT